MILLNRSKDNILWFLGVVLTVTTLLVALHFDQVKKHLSERLQRTPASLGDDVILIKGKPNPTQDKPAHQVREKTGDSLKVDVKALQNSNKDGYGAQSGFTVDLEAKVSVTDHLGDLKFIWILPSGVRVERGEVTGTITGLEPGSTDATLRISIKSDVPENRKVHLHVYRMVNGEAQGYIRQYNTIDQDRIDRDLLEKAQLFRSELEKDKKIRIVQ